MLVVFFKKKAKFSNLTRAVSSFIIFFFKAQCQSDAALPCISEKNVFLDICEVFLGFVAVVFFCRFYIKYQLMNCLFSVGFF